MTVQDSSRDRFEPPAVGPATRVRFPGVARDRLAQGLRIWTITHATAPVVNVALLFDGGTADDPPDRPGLAAISADLLDEGADGLDAIALADALARLGTRLDVGVLPDLTTVGFSAVSRSFRPALACLASVVRRPHLFEADLQRIRDLRVGRLAQLRQSAGAVAERAFARAVFGRHGYGHGSIGTTRALETFGVDDVRAWHRRTCRPSQATLVIGGDVTPEAALDAAREVFAGWTDDGDAAGAGRGAIDSLGAPRILLVDRPGAPQSVLRVGHLGPPRSTPAYHALTTLNAVIGGQFSSRINRHLRESRGVTYGARTAFDYRRDAGAFVCETSVQPDATASAIADIVSELAAVRTDRPVTPEELARAQNAITRGYVRGFETAAHLVRAAGELAAFHLPDDTFDRFVPGIEAQTGETILDAARRFIDPDRLLAVVVGDAARVRASMDALGWPVDVASPEF